MENLSAGKWPGGGYLGQQLSPSVSPQLVTVATVRNNATVVKGKVGEVAVEIILDTGSAVSLLHHKEAGSMNTHPSSQGCSSIQLVTTSGESLPIVSCVKASAQITDDHLLTSHQFFVVDSLIYPVILGTDFLHEHHLRHFLHEHHLRLDFTSSSVTIQHNISDLDCIQPLWDATVEAKAK